VAAGPRAGSGSAATHAARGRREHRWSLPPEPVHTPGDSRDALAGPGCWVSRWHALQPGEDTAHGPLAHPAAPGMAPADPRMPTDHPGSAIAICPPRQRKRLVPCQGALVPRGYGGHQGSPQVPSGSPPRAPPPRHPAAHRPARGIGVRRGRCPARSRARGARGPRRHRVPPRRAPGCPSPGQGGSRDGAGQSGTRRRGGKFVKKVLNTDFPGYQKENLCIAFEFNFSIKAFSL